MMAAWFVIRPIWLLVPIFGLLIFLLPTGHRLPGSWSTFVQPSMREYLTRFVPGSSTVNTRWMRWLVCVLVCVALAGISFGFSENPPIRDVHGRYVVIDVGAQEPLQPAIFAARQLIKSAVNMPTGLIAAGADAYDVVPVTNDPAQLDRYLRVLDPTVMPDQGRMLERGIVRAQQSMKRVGLSARQIVVLTAGKAPRTLASSTTDKNTKVWIVLEQKPSQEWQRYADSINANVSGFADLASLDNELGDMRDRAIRSATPIRERRDLTPWFALACLPFWALLFFRRERNR